MDTFFYQITPAFAQANNLPQMFTAVIKKETVKAEKVYGKLTPILSKKYGKCFFCGTTLNTDKVGYHIGVCKRCGPRIGTWRELGGYKMSNKNKLESIVGAVRLDTWIPKRAILLKEKSRISILSLQEEKTIRKIKAEYAAYREKNPIPIHCVAKLHGSQIRLQFPADKKNVAFIKSLIGAKYRKGAETYWSVDAGMYNAVKLRERGFILDNGVRQLSEDKHAKKYERVNTKTLQPIAVSGLLRHPYPYQGVGIHFINLKQGRGLIGDDMGIGKTMQALAYTALCHNEYPVLIICPASLKYNWLEELDKTIPNHRTQVLSGQKPHAITADYVIINYDILKYWISYIRVIQPQIIITDECHKYKNPKAQRTKAVLAVCKGVDKIIAMSGTPIDNRPVEFFTVLHLLAPSIFPNEWAYKQRYCGAKKGYFGWDFTGASNMKELHEKIDGVIMIRRLKAEVLTELPPKIFSFVPLEIDNRREYNKAEKNFVQFLKDGVDKDVDKIEAQLKAELAAFMKEKGIKEYDMSTHKLPAKAIQEMKEQKETKMNPLTHMEILRQVAAEGKMKQTIKWIEDFLESGEKLVVFAIHRFVIDTLMEHFGKIAVKIDGSVSTGPKRQAIVNEFQNNSKIRLFVGNIKAAGEGITLTAASNVAIIEYPDTPGALAQAPDRCHRIGQKDAVNVWYLFAVNTIEDKTARNLDKKVQILSKILDGKDTPETTLFADLMSDYKKLI